MNLSFLRDLGETLYEKSSKHKWVTKIIFAILVCIITLFLYNLKTFNRIELLSLDYRFSLRQVEPRSTKIIFIDMSEDSISAIGRWPWPRKWHATLLKIFSEYKPKVVLFDVLLTEPQDELDDLAFEQALSLLGNVYLPYMFNISKLDIRSLYRGEGIISVLKPLNRFQRYLPGTGFVNIIPDPDGIMRRVIPIVEYGGRRFYQLGFKVACDLLGIKEEDIKFYPRRHLVLLKAKGGKDIKIRLDATNQLIINWRAKWGEAFEHYSYIDVIRSYALIKSGKKPILNLHFLKDKICIIGLTAAGLIDIKPIPIQNAYPAVGIHAMVISSILERKFVIPLSNTANVWIIIFVSFAVTFYLCGLRPLTGMYSTAGLVFVYFLFSILMFILFNISITTVYPIFAVVISYGTTATYNQILQSIERARLFRQATRDGLTNLYNIRHFNLLYEAEFKNIAAHRHRPLSIIMTDIDNFKHVNDTFGHQAGDQILVNVAKILQSKVRQVDVVGRYGGEEFIVMLTGANKDEAYNVAEKIRQEVARLNFTFGGKPYNPTISIGVAEYMNEQSKEELVKKADTALYEAKRTGKNKVVIYSEASSKNMH